MNSTIDEMHRKILGKNKTNFVGGLISAILSREKLTEEEIELIKSRSKDEKRILNVKISTFCHLALEICGGIKYVGADEEVLHYLGSLEKEYKRDWSKKYEN